MALIKSAYQWSLSGNAATMKVNPAVQAVVLLLSSNGAEVKAKAAFKPIITRRVSSHSSGAV